MSTDCIYIIDTFSLMFQVFHAIPAMTGTQGQPTNAVFGFTRDLFAILDRKPTHLLCAFDSPGPGKRNEIYEAYKANRSEMPEDLRPQIPLLKELMQGFRIPVVECPAWEADDVIATVATSAAAAGMEVVIVSGDKDIRQLLSPRIRLLNCRKGEFLDEAGLMADWGVRPDQVVDYQSLVGDSVDNVPGVPKVGPKTAKTLIDEYGTLDHILANADKVSGKVLQKNLKEFADQARMSRELVRLRTDLQLNLDLESARIAEPDRPLLFELFTRLGFRRYSAMMRDSAATDESSAPAASVAESNLSTTDLHDHETLATRLASLSNAAEIFVEYSAAGKLLPDKHVTAIALAGQGDSRIQVSASGSDGQSLVQSVLKWLAQYTGRVVTSDAKPLAHCLLNNGLTVPSALFDTSIADYLLDAGARSHDLADVADRYAGGSTLTATPSPTRRPRQKTMFDESEDTVVPPTAALDPDRLNTLVAVTPGLQAALERDELCGLYYDLEQPLIDVLVRLEHAGISVDAAELKQQSQKAGVRIDTLTDEVFAAAGCQFNIDSPKQLGEVLFEKLKLPVLKKTKTGASTDQEVLEQLALVHPLPAKIIERRQLTKLKGTYLDTLPELIHPRTGRIHATFHQTVAATGRLSASDPNLQNIPVRTEEGRQVRRAFQAGTPGWQLICADYSQVELRVLAHFSQDEALLDAFRQGIDIHAAVAADVFQVPVESVTSDQRRVAKAVNFGVIYGQSPFGLAAALNIEKAEAAHFIDSYFLKYKGVADFCTQVLEDTVRTGYARTILNRRRAITGIRSTTGTQRNMPERTAINTVIQGSAADLIKLAMIQLDRTLTSSQLRATMLLQIHDELVFESHPDDVPQLIPMVVAGMQNALSLRVPLVVDVTHGPNWLDQSDV